MCTRLDYTEDLQREGNTETVPLTGLFVPFYIHKEGGGGGLWPKAGGCITQTFSHLHHWKRAEREREGLSGGGATHLMHQWKT